MRQLNIESFGTKRPTSPNSILVWNGIGFELCEEILMSDLTGLARSVKRSSINVEFSAKARATDLTRLGLTVDGLDKWLKDAQAQFNDLFVNVSNYLIRLEQAQEEVAQLERLTITIDNDLANITQVTDSILSGNFLAGGAQHSVRFDGDACRYTVTRLAHNKSTLIADSTIYFEEIGERTYKVNYDPFKNLPIVAGDESVSVLEGTGTKTIHLGTVLVSSPTIAVDSMYSSHSIRPRDSAIQSSHHEVSVTKIPSKGYSIGLKPKLSMAMEFAISEGDGIKIDGSFISVDREAVFTLEQSDDVLVDYEPNADGSSSPKYLLEPTNLFSDPNNIEISAGFPMVSTSNGGATPTYTLSLDGQYVNDLDGILDNIDTALSALTSKYNGIGLTDTSEQFKRVFASPILNMFDILTKAKLPTLQGGLPSISHKLVAGFGRTSPFLVDIDVNLLGAATATMFGEDNAGTGATFGTVLKFNAYLVLERWVREQLSDPLFTISSLDLGNVFNLVAIEGGSVVVAKEKEDVFTSLDYNTGIGVGNAMSQTKPNSPLLFTLGDIDFWRGKIRHGQSNLEPVVLDAVIDGDSNDLDLAVRKVGVSVEDSGDGSSHITVVLIDDYLGAGFNFTWSKPNTIQDKESDYLTEIDGGVGAPPYLRFIARLIAGWGYDMPDVNRVFKYIKEQAALIDSTGRDHLYEQVNQLGTNLAGNSRIPFRVGIEVVSMDKQSGDCEVKLVSNVPTKGFSALLASKIRGAWLPLRFHINPLRGNDYNLMADLEARSCLTGLSKYSTLDLSDVEVDCENTDLGTASLFNFSGLMSGGATPNVSKLGSTARAVSPAQLSECADMLFGNLFDIPVSTTPKPTTTTPKPTTTTPRPTEKPEEPKCEPVFDDSLGNVTGYYLKAGQSVEDIIRQRLSSEHGLNNIPDNIFYAVHNQYTLSLKNGGVGRHPDLGGLAYWIKEWIRNNWSQAQFVAAFQSSPSYKEFHIKHAGRDFIPIKSISCTTYS